MSNLKAPLISRAYYFFIYTQPITWAKAATKTKNIAEAQKIRSHSRKLNARNLIRSKYPLFKIKDKTNVSITVT